MEASKSTGPQSVISNYIPFSAIVGQAQMKLALEIAFVQPRIRGVLLAGERGTAKSTLARAFAGAFCDKPMVTLPINATEDRVVGGWNIEKLVNEGISEEVTGLLEDADGTILYIDEVNLLEDHIVNIILDVSASGVLVIQHEYRTREARPRFTMVGTMNPEEGNLRPQLLDRFDLFVEAATEETQREDVLRAMLELDSAMTLLACGESSALHNELVFRDDQRRQGLIAARRRCAEVTFADGVLKNCCELASGLKAAGHRGERVLALAAQAVAAIEGSAEVTTKSLRELAPLALRHRSRLVEGEPGRWTDLHQQVVDRLLR